MNNSIGKVWTLLVQLRYPHAMTRSYSCSGFSKRTLVTNRQRSFHSPSVPRRSATTATAANTVNKADSGGSRTVTPGEVEKFEKMSSSWWDPNGQMKELHSMNRLRVPLIRDGLLADRKDLHDIAESPAPLKGYELVDIGCGGGILTEPLGRLGARITGIDPGKENISTAEVHLSPGLRDRVSYDCCTIEDYAAKNPEKEFDGVVMSEIIEHVENPEAFLEIAVGMTKVGGSLFLTTLNRTFESWAGAIVAWEYLLRRLPVGTHEWNKFLTPQQLQGILINNGCRVKLIHGMCYNPLRNSWNWTKSTSINYAIHAIREN